MFRISQLKITQISKFHLLTALMHGKMAPVSTLGKAEHNCPLNLSQVIHKAEILVNLVSLDIL
jgi:hypothetical protein